MAKSHSIIAPFPDNMDRHEYGIYVSGVTAGEGCFRLGWSKDRRGEAISGYAAFLVLMRADEIALLNRIHSFWRCGKVKRRPPPRKRPNANPTACLLITNAYDLARVVVPHFERHTMPDAKKTRDFEIWKQGVELICRLKAKPRVPGRSRWTDRAKERFGSLVKAIKETRKFSDDPVATPEIPETPAIRSLLDLLEAG